MHRLTCWIVAGMALTAVFVAVPQIAPVQAATTASVSCADPLASGSASQSGLDSYTAINPQRVVDTRDGTGGVAGPLAAGCTLRIDFAQGSVPTSAEAVSLSVTAVAPRRGFLTVFPCANGRPPTSNLNTRAAMATPNLVVGLLDANRAVCIYSSDVSDVIVDVAGWWSPGGDRFGAVPPDRAYDSREIPGRRPLAAREVHNVAMAGSFVPADATAAVVNLTVTEPAGPGFLVAFPCGSPVPLASNVNFLGGESRAVSAIVGLGEGGELCVMSSIAAHVVVDVTGYYAPAPQFGPASSLEAQSGRRVMDSRSGVGGPAAPFATGEARAIDPVAGTVAAEDGTSVVLNVIALNAQGPGYLTLYPCGGPVPFVSSVNFTAETEATNLVVADLSDSRAICVYASIGVDVVIDLFGVMRAPIGSLAERISFGFRTWPAYTPAGTDYAIDCNAGTTTLDVRVDPLPLTTATLDGGALAAGSNPRAAQTDQLLTLTLTRGVQSRTYYFRCLPADFPELSIDRPGEPQPGWYLTTFGALGAPNEAPFSVIMDNRGAPVWYKRVSEGVIDFKRFSDGRLFFTPILGQGFGVQPERGYWETTLAGGPIVGQFLTEDDDPNDTVDFPTDHHDFVELLGGPSAGGHGMITYPVVRDQDLTPLNAVLPRQCSSPLGGPVTPCEDDDTVMDNVIQEFDAGGDMVWDWSVMSDGGFAPTDSILAARFGLLPAEPNGGEVDPFHMNSLDAVNDGTGDYVASLRHLDAVVRIDHATGDLDWVLGGPDRPERLDVVGDPLGGPARMHDARLVGDVLTMFDNRSGTGQAARAVAYRIDEGAGTATMLWQISEP
ncbi:MAG: aryl-sulfate sulfotransferase, partial [Ilumatobacteraceae bacterium]